MKELVYRSPLGGPRRFAAWLNDLRASSGAYVIRDRKSGRVLYVGESHSGRLAATIKRHFHAWRDSTDRVHFTYGPALVEVAARVTPPPAAIGAQNNLIRRLSPRDNIVGVSEPEPEQPF